MDNSDLHQDMLLERVRKNKRDPEKRPAQYKIEVIPGEQTVWEHNQITYKVPAEVRIIFLTEEARHAFHHILMNSQSIHLRSLETAMLESGTIENKLRDDLYGFFDWSKHNGSYITIIDDEHMGALQITGGNSKPSKSTVKGLFGRWWSHGKGWFR